MSQGLDPNGPPLGGSIVRPYRKTPIDKCQSSMVITKDVIITVCSTACGGQEGVSIRLSDRASEHSAMDK